LIGPPVGGCDLSDVELPRSLNALEGQIYSHGGLPNCCQARLDASCAAQCSAVAVVQLVACHHIETWPQPDVDAIKMAFGGSRVR
jgi:hypothetical protein